MSVTIKFRSPLFAARLTRACDTNLHCPPLHKGRLTWLKDQLEQRGLQVTVESIRRWLSGEGRPTQEKCKILADTLGVDAVYLYMGERTAPAVVENHDNPAGSFEHSLTMSLRPNITITVNGLPADLTPVEASRISNVIRAFAGVDR